MVSGEVHNEGKIKTMASSNLSCGFVLLQKALFIVQQRQATNCLQNRRKINDFSHIIDLQTGLEYGFIEDIETESNGHQPEPITFSKI